MLYIQLYTVTYHHMVMVSATAWRWLRKRSKAKLWNVFTWGTGWNHMWNTTVEPWNHGDGGGEHPNPRCAKVWTTKFA